MACRLAERTTLGTTSGFFNGMIDEVRIYSRALGQAEIQRDMNTGVDAAGNLSGPPPPACREMWYPASMRRTFQPQRIRFPKGHLG
jgi:hypothetical protein